MTRSFSSIKLRRFRPPPAFRVWMHRFVASSFLFATIFAARTYAQMPQATGNSFIARYQARVSATQAEQPHWITPLVTVTPRLEQEIRADFVHQYNPKRFAVWNYGNSKGLELIPERHTEIIINV